MASLPPFSRPIWGLLLDLDGVVYVRGAPLPGALASIARLRAAGVPFRFVTNTTRKPRRRILADLAAMGLALAPEDLFTPASLAREALIRRGARPCLLIHPDLAEDFAGLEEGDDVVVLGDAGAYFTYERLNRAFRLIHGGADFWALARNRNFLDGDGALSLDLGGFVAALEYASGRQARIFGKPAPDFFRLAVAALGLAPERVLMVGDDAEADVGGAMAAGLCGALVRTGKYQPGQEARLPLPPDVFAEDLPEVVALLLDQR
jgi:HAD superfamily hydrolase (TIGR01458 family)